MKLIKLSDTHYIIVEDSEIKEGDWIYAYYTSSSPMIAQVLSIDSNTGLDGHIEYDVFFENGNYSWGNDAVEKIIYSTQPLEQTEWRTSKNGEHHRPLIFDKIKPLSLSEVEEVINGYNVEEMAFKDTKRCGFNNTSYAAHTIQSFINGFKAHQELVKDKLFTIEDVKKAIQIFYYDDILLTESNLNEVIQSLLPKTKWDVEFVDGKLKLM